jgi:hypothetical protein
VDTSRIEEIAAIAATHGTCPVAVLPMRTTAGDERFACAFPARERFRWLVLDGAGAVIVDAVAIRDAAEVIAMCETAEEAAAALAAVEAVAGLDVALPLAAGFDDAGLAIRAMHEALAPLIAMPAGVRVAEGAYLDRVAIAAALVGDRFDLLREAALASSARLSGTPGEPGEPLAEALWNLVRLLARDGPPDRFRESIEGAMGTASAFADDVLDNYLVDLSEEDR